MNWKRIVLIVAVLAICATGGFVGAATFSDFTSGDLKLSRSAIDPSPDYVPFIQYRKFDFNDSAFGSGSGVTGTDVGRLFNVGKDTFITEFGFMNLRPLHTGTSATVGDGNDTSGYVASTYSHYNTAAGNEISKGVPFIDFTTVGTGVSVWRYMGPMSGGAGYVITNGVSQYYSGSSGSTAWTVAHNYGTYFTQSGISCYGSADTIDMTFLTDKACGSRVTPYFEAYIKGFKRVVP